MSGLALCFFTGHHVFQYFCRLLICQQAFEVNLKSWEESLTSFKSENRAKEWDVSLFDKRTGLLSFQEQLEYVNSLPNYHRWLWNLSDPVKQQIKFQQRFACSSRYLPGSPRSRILSALSNPGGESLVVSTLKVLLGIYEAEKASAPKKRKIVKKKPRQAVDVAKIYESLGVNEEEAYNLCRNVSTLHERASLYQYYVERLFNDGTLAWRVKSASVQVLLMNDYDSETGNFKVLSRGKNCKGKFLA